MPPVSCSILQIYLSISTLDRLKSLTVFLALSAIPPVRYAQKHPQPPEPQTTAGFLSYHSSVVNVPPFSQPRNAQIVRFAIALRPPSRHCRPQGTSPNFTTAPIPCQIRCSLFFFVFRSNPASLPLSPPLFIPKNRHRSSTGSWGTITYFTTPSPSSQIPIPQEISNSQNQPLAYATYTHAPHPYFISSLTNVLPPSSYLLSGG